MELDGPEEPTTKRDVDVAPGAGLRQIIDGWKTTALTTRRIHHGDAARSQRRHAVDPPTHAARPDANACVPGDGIKEIIDGWKTLLYIVIKVDTDSLSCLKDRGIQNTGSYDALLPYELFRRR